VRGSAKIEPRWGRQKGRGSLLKGCPPKVREKKKKEEGKEIEGGITVEGEKKPCKKGERMSMRRRIRTTSANPAWQTKGSQSTAHKRLIGKR